VSAFFAELAWLGAEAGVVGGVVVESGAGGQITSVRPGAEAPPGAVRLPGLVLPGFVNAHSHAFHRALRGRSESHSGDFWTWRDFMYAVAATLEPDSYRELATATYAEMLLAGYTTVGEFHYLHHAAGGVAYADPNEMGLALVGAATAAGIRMTLIDACYLQAGVDGSPLEGVQLRFGDASGEAWAGRVERLAARYEAADVVPLGLPRLGVAAHSVRAVPEASIATVAAVAADHDWPLHVHVSEQRRENEECLKVTGRTPTDVLKAAGALSGSTTVVHATHASAGDVARLGLSGVCICACPTTERDLGDGVGPFSDLSDAGTSLCIGSDSHSVLDPFEETRAIELNERLALERRGLWRVPALLEAATSGGAASLGWPAGGIAIGNPCDLVAVRLDSPGVAGSGRLAGAVGGSEQLLACVMFGAAPSDVDTVVVGGAVVVEAGEHTSLGSRQAVAERLDRAITAVVAP
jgi:formiminoglutamate deiminase